jgi:hypothetical protein
MASERNSALVIHALRSVCETFGTDPSSAAMLLRQALEPNHVRKYGHEELQWITRYVDKQLRLDPGLVRDLYIAAFSWKETSDDPTSMGSGQIFPLRSNRKQDYQQVRWLLAQKYPQFLAYAPDEAAVAMIAAVKAYVHEERDDSRKLWASIRKDYEMEESGPTDEPVLVEQTFSVQGETSTLILDDSLHYDRDWADEHALGLLNTFFRHLDSVASAGPSDQLFEVIALLLRENRLGLIWSRLLKLAAAHDFLAIHLKELAWAKPLLLALTTEKSLQEFLKRLHPLLTKPEQKSLIECIEGLSDSVPQDEKDASAERSKILLQVISLTAEEKPRQQFDSGALDRREVEALFSDSAPSADAAEVIPDPRRDRFQRLKAHVRDFAGNNAQQVPSLAEARRIFKHLQELKSLMKRCLPETDAELRSGSAPAFLAAACTKIAGIKSLTPSSALGKFVKNKLIAFAVKAEAAKRLNDNEKSEQSNISRWSQIGTESARGLLTLATKPSFVDRALINALNGLARDPAEAVRREIASNCWLLYRNSPNHVWRWIEHLVLDDSIFVREAAVHTLGRLATERVDRAIPLVISTLHATPREKEESDRVIEICMRVILDSYAWKASELAGTELNTAIANVTARHKDLGYILFPLREPLTHGAIDTDDSRHAVRKRAVELLIKLVRNTSELIKQMLEQRRAGVMPTEHEQEQFQILLKLANSIAHEVYFASGAYQPDKQHHAPTVQKPEQERFYREAGTVFDDLAVIGLPSLAHHLVETLELFVPVDPPGVFLRVAAIVKAGKMWGYEYEDVAQDLITRIIERYLAEYRSILQQDRHTQTALRETLETFITAAWPRAQALAYKVDEIFR